MSDALRITDDELRYLAAHDKTYVSVLAQTLLDERTIHARCFAALRSILPLAIIGAERRKTQLCDEQDAAEVMQIDRDLDVARAALVEEDA